MEATIRIPITQHATTIMDITTRTVIRDITATTVTRGSIMGIRAIMAIMAATLIALTAIEPSEAQPIGVAFKVDFAAASVVDFEHNPVPAAESEALERDVAEKEFGKDELHLSSSLPPQRSVESTSESFPLLPRPLHNTAPGFLLRVSTSFHKAELPQDECDKRLGSATNNLT